MNDCNLLNPSVSVTSTNLVVAQAGALLNTTMLMTNTANTHVIYSTRVTVVPSIRVSYIVIPRRFFSQYRAIASISPKYDV